MTRFLCREDSYQTSNAATVTEITPDGGIVLDATVFYATSGGQPGDSGRLMAADGRVIAISTAIHPDGDKTRIVHVPTDSAPGLAPGDRVTAEIDWDRRLKLMRMHTALHLVTVALPFPVTGGSVAEDKGRLDFNMDTSPDAAALEVTLNSLVAAGHAVSAEWITDEDMAANPGLIKSMNVKPPMGQGRVRLIRIGDVDLQPCGGTHVRNTAEIGPLRVGKFEKNGSINRRVSIHFV
jgi:misacylated tRNA(Ala) deacylase